MKASLTRAATLFALRDRTAARLASIDAEIKALERTWGDASGYSYLKPGMFRRAVEALTSGSRAA